MHRTRVPHKVRTRPRMSGKELERKKITFESIARPAGDHEVARIVKAASRQRHDVIERRGSLIKMRRTVYAALPAVAKGGAAHRALEGRVHDPIRSERHQMSWSRPLGWDLAATRPNGRAFGGTSPTRNTATRKAKIGMSRHQHDPPP